MGLATLCEHQGRGEKVAIWTIWLRTGSSQQRMTKMKSGGEGDGLSQREVIYGLKRNQKCIFENFSQFVLHLCTFGVTLLLNVFNSWIHKYTKVVFLWLALSVRSFINLSDPFALTTIDLHLRSRPLIWPQCLFINRNFQLSNERPVPASNGLNSSIISCIQLTALRIRR